MNRMQRAALAGMLSAMMLRYVADAEWMQILAWGAFMISWLIFVLGDDAHPGQD